MCNISCKVETNCHFIRKCFYVETCRKIKSVNCTVELHWKTPQSGFVVGFQLILLCVFCFRLTLLENSNLNVLKPQIKYLVCCLGLALAQYAHVESFLSFQSMKSVILQHSWKKLLIKPCLTWHCGVVHISSSNDTKTALMLVTHNYYVSVGVIKAHRVMTQP